MSLKKAISAVEKAGILLVYPIDNRSEPPSIWSSLYPNSEMRWEWNEEGDSRVADLWHLRRELSTSGKVVYAKWYNGRATFFSRPVYTNLLSFFAAHEAGTHLERESSKVLNILRSDSPLSTKQLRQATGLTGKLLGSTYERALKQLWRKFLIVGFGEVDDGAFPSLAVGATELLFEDLWVEAKKISSQTSAGFLRTKLLENSLFLRKIEKEHQAQQSI